MPFVDLPHRGRDVRLEYEWVGREAETAPVVVFLHEGLGSVAMWRDWPARLCDLGGYRGLVYSRYGYGRSTRRPHDEHWSPRFMHDEAAQALPRLLAAVGVDAKQRPPWLLGHSDGGSIALMFAALHPDAVAGVIAVAPHIRVEDVTIASIERAREAWRTTDLPQRLGRYHADAESAFGGWNAAWLAPDFRAWSIEAMLPAVRCPLLAVQGRDDEYGTLAQIEGIRARAPQTELLVLEDCGHSPQRDQPDALAHAVTGFISRHQVAVHSGGMS